MARIARSALTATSHTQNAALVGMAIVRKENVVHVVMVTVRRVSVTSAAMATVRRVNATHAPMAIDHKANELLVAMVSVHKAATAPTGITPRARSACSATIWIRCNRSGSCNSRRHCVAKAQSRRVATMPAPVNASMDGTINTPAPSTGSVASPMRHGQPSQQQPPEPSHLGALRRKKNKTPNKSRADRTDALWH